MTTKEAKAISLKALVDKENKRVIYAESDVDFTDVLFSFLTMPMGTIIRLISNHNQPPTVAVGCMTNLYESIKNLDMQYFRTEACKTMLLCPEMTPHLLSEKTEKKLVFDAQDRGVFVKGLNQFIISDELQVKPSSIEASVSVLSKLGLTDCSSIEEYNYYNIDVRVDEVLTLLKCSLVSKKPLTETLLKQNSAPKFSKEDFDQNIYVESTVEEPESNVDGKIHVKLIISKSKKMVCFAEAIPKLAPDFSYDNHPLGIEEGLHPTYRATEYYEAYRYRYELTSYDQIRSGFEQRRSILTVKGPKSHFKEATRGGYVTGSTMFTVTDNLIITPISQFQSLSLLNKLKVPFSDIEESVVHVGREKALRLLVASFVSESALTNAFLREPNPNFS
ncbi:hypothetical protein Pint_32628 [Pistacia integerrima]|uniref:Uncharacterized protein n=1 Tax=Pistacia integerrima TaxID=434235 RepID=A0ACC0XNY3_9ROSI|nr:hypothetical protein Pint_32628 [Pistacia integerrima]